MEWLIIGTVIWLFAYSAGRKSKQREYNAIGGMLRKMLSGKD
jgi:hypothetical protein